MFSIIVKICFVIIFDESLQLVHVFIGHFNLVTIFLATNVDNAKLLKLIWIMLSKSMKK